MVHRFEAVSRRELLQAAVAGFISAEMASSGSHGLAFGQPLNPQRRNAEVAAVKALVFDVFGTVVDWRTSVAREVEELAKRKGLRVDGAKFADAWRAQYRPSMERVRNGDLPWTKLDDLHRMILDKISPEYGIAGISEPEIAALNRAWHRLHPWPDSVGGLTRLKKKFIIAPLSNGNIALMTNMARHSGLPWDCILGAELVRHYKPDREVYQSAADFLGLQTNEVLMVAAHLRDLAAAKGVGLRTAFVARPLEYGPGGTPDLTPDSSADFAARDFHDLADQLGA